MAPPSLDDIYETAKKETAKGALYGFTISTGLSLLANRFSPLYRSINLPGKCMLISMATAGYAGYRGEHSLFHSSRATYKSDLVTPIPTNYSWPEWLYKHRLGVALSSASVGLAGSYWYFRENKLRSPAQKFMSLRIFTQAFVFCTFMSVVALKQYFGESSNKNDNDNKIDERSK